MNKEGQVNTANSDWIYVEDKENPTTIADYPYNTGVDMSITKPHCWRCIVVNKCWFKNDKDKKPSPMSYTFALIRKLFEIFGLDVLLGLYHPFCHCHEKPIENPLPEQIKLKIMEGKIDWAMTNKLHLLKTMGYSIDDREEVVEILSDLTKKAYCKGQYTIRQVNNYGCQITVKFYFPGK